LKIVSLVRSGTDPPPLSIQTIWELTGQPRPHRTRCRASNEKVPPCDPWSSNALTRRWTSSSISVPTSARNCSFETRPLPLGVAAAHRCTCGGCGMPITFGGRVPAQFDATRRGTRFPVNYNLRR
jgi:hypothetical protein